MTAPITRFVRRSYSAAAQNHQWAIKMHSARILLDLNAHDEAEQALVAPETLPEEPLHAPAVQLAALRAKTDAVFTHRPRTIERSGPSVSPSHRSTFEQPKLISTSPKPFLGWAKPKRHGKQLNRL